MGSETGTPLGRLLDCSIDVVREVALEAWRQITKLEQEVQLVQVCCRGTTGVDVVLETRRPQDEDYVEYAEMNGEWSPRQMAWGDLINRLVEKMDARVSACSGGDEPAEVIVLDTEWLESQWRGGREYGYTYGAGRRALSAEEAKQMIEKCPSRRRKGVMPRKGAEQSSGE